LSSITEEHFIRDPPSRRDQAELNVCWSCALQKIRESLEVAKKVLPRARLILPSSPFFFHSFITTGRIFLFEILSLALPVHNRRLHHQDKGCLSAARQESRVAIMSNDMRDLISGEAELDDDDDESLDEEVADRRRRQPRIEDSSEEEEDDDDEEEARKVCCLFP
jgi:hypothetical protein